MHPLEVYLHDLREIRATGAGVKETSFYPPLANLLNAIGQQLKPRVRCVINLKNQGAGLPDGGLFTPDQFPKGAGEPPEGQLPARGAIEFKGTKDDAWVTADSDQVTGYWNKYRQVLVTNYRDFVLVARDEATGQPVKRETFRLADSEKAFWNAAAHPATLVASHGDRFIEYLKRVMLHASPLADPKDVAWFLASYARDAKARMDAAPLPALDTVRQAMEEALGLGFEGDKGDHFFRSTLVQTLFYGVFSAWVLWHRQHPPLSPVLRGEGSGVRGRVSPGQNPSPPAPLPGVPGRGGPSAECFDWEKSPKYLHVPILRKLFRELADPMQLQEWRLDEVLDWTAGVLNRVDRAVFFAQVPRRRSRPVLLRAVPRSL